MTTSTIWLGVSLVGTTVYCVHRIFLKRNPAPLPPGPKPLPILGNLFDLPTETPWVTYAEWSKSLGTWFAMLEYSVLIVLMAIGRGHRSRPDIRPTHHRS